MLIDEEGTIVDREKVNNVIAGPLESNQVELDAVRSPDGTNELRLYAESKNVQVDSLSGDDIRRKAARYFATRKQLDGQSIDGGSMTLYVSQEAVAENIRSKIDQEWLSVKTTPVETRPPASG